jgi:hypothetical protein
MTITKNQVRELLRQKGCAGKYSGHTRTMYVHGKGMQHEGEVIQSLPLADYRFRIVSHHSPSLKSSM